MRGPHHRIQIRPDSCSSLHARTYRPRILHRNRRRKQCRSRCHSAPRFVLPDGNRAALCRSTDCKAANNPASVPPGGRSESGCSDAGNRYSNRLPPTSHSRTAHRARWHSCAKRPLLRAAAPSLAVGHCSLNIPVLPGQQVKSKPESRCRRRRASCFPPIVVLTLRVRTCPRFIQPPNQDLSIVPSRFIESAQAARSELSAQAAFSPFSENSPYFASLDARCGANLASESQDSRFPNELL